jgi:integrase
MPPRAEPLGPLQVKQITKPGLNFVGTVSGLGLLVSKNGTRSWVLRTKIGSKRRDVGLGAFPEISLAQAHDKARKAKDAILNGIDPIGERKRLRNQIEWTFDRAAEEYISLHREGWKNAKHAAQWVSTLANYVAPVFGSKHVKDITTGDVLAVIQPHWLTKNETMVRVRNRIELVLGWSASRGYRTTDNPAVWRGHLEHSLPAPSKVNKREHHAAMPYRELHNFIERLAQVDGMSARALEWVILTACRSGEARGATWNEIDLEAGLWTVPGSRMKAGREHRSPLSPQAIKLLQVLPRIQPPDGQPDYLFPGRSGGQLSDMSLTTLMRRMKVNAVPHGMRSSFADWAAEQTNYPVELREMALAHTLGDKTREAYQRTDLMERRRLMMCDWARYLHTKPSTASVTNINAAKAA